MVAVPLLDPPIVRERPLNDARIVARECISGQTSPSFVFADSFLNDFPRGA